jgi:2-desacetyl-2-hydroxyethyl bacteriochlorophyllide A dehydrogenase
MDKSLRYRVQFVAPGDAEVVTEESPVPDPNQVSVRTKYSAISPGTERLVYQGNVPDDLQADSSIEALRDKNFSYPISYGYACVGEVEEVGTEVRDDWIGTRVFAFQPHASRFVASPDALIRLPDTVKLTDAVLIPPMETAVTLTMDGRPMIGERVYVFGQGGIGLLTARLLAEHPVNELVAVEPLEARRSLSASLGIEAVGTADDLKRRESEIDSVRADLVFELTGDPSALNDAIQRTAFDGRIVVGSWYGTKATSLDLGGHFHRSRMEIISSQVSTIDPSYRGRWTKERRMSVVLDLLADMNPGELISDQYEIEQAPIVYEKLVNDPSLVQPVFVYDSFA